MMNRIIIYQVLLISILSVLTGCETSSTPYIDANFGKSLKNAEQAQQIPVSDKKADASLDRPTSMESRSALEGFVINKPALPAIQSPITK